MFSTSHRAFLSDVGKGMLSAGLGTALVNDLGFSTSFAEDGSDSVPLGEHSRLVELMRNTPAEKLQSLLAEKILNGEADLKKLTAAGALANAITFGGCDDVGFHTAMAMLPALEMSRLLTSGRQPLPVLKVLYRNAQQIQSAGSSSKVALEAFHAAEHAADDKIDVSLGLRIRDACRHADVDQGEKLFASATGSPSDVFNLLPYRVRGIPDHSTRVSVESRRWTRTGDFQFLRL